VVRYETSKKLKGQARVFGRVTLFSIRATSYPYSVVECINPRGKAVLGQPEDREKRQRGGEALSSAVVGVKT